MFVKLWSKCGTLQVDIDVDNDIDYSYYHVNHINQTIQTRSA